MAQIKVKRVLIDPKFVGYVCCRCDRWMEFITLHLGFVKSDVRCEHGSYAYLGDVGGRASLTFAREATEKDRSICSHFFGFLLGSAYVLSELGLTLQFGDDGKHSVSHHPVDVLVEEDYL